MTALDLTHATQSTLTEALLQTHDGERRVDAACAAGDQIRFGEIPSLDPALRDALIMCATEGDWSELRFEAAIALCEAKHPRGAVLLELMDDRGRRFDACKALSRIDTPAVREAMRKQQARFFLQWTDRLVASGVCAVFGDKDGAAYFERTLVSRFFGARRAMALHLLGELRHPEAFTILSAMIDDKDNALRHVAIRALGHLGDRRAVPSLRSLNDNDVAEDVRYALDLLTP